MYFVEKLNTKFHIRRSDWILLNTRRAVKLVLNGNRFSRLSVQWQKQTTTWYFTNFAMATPNFIKKKTKFVLRLAWVGKLMGPLNARIIEWKNMSSRLRIYVTRRTKNENTRYFHCFSVSFRLGSVSFETNRRYDYICPKMLSQELIEKKPMHLILP